MGGVKADCTVYSDSLSLVVLRLIVSVERPSDWGSAPGAG